MSKMTPRTTIRSPILFCMDSSWPYMKIEIKIEKSFLVEVTIDRNSALKVMIAKAMKNEPDIDWLLDNQESIIHKYYQMGLDGKI